MRSLGDAADAASLDRFHLLGHSAGGAVSLAFAAARWERFLSLAFIEPAWAGNEGPRYCAHTTPIGSSATSATMPKSPRCGMSSV